TRDPRGDGPARHGRRPGGHDRGHRHHPGQGPQGTRSRRMKLSREIIEQLAIRLETCELEAKDTTKITDDHPDMDWDDAYAIQDEIRRRKVARGAKIIGLKAGLTSHAKMKQMG